MAITPEIRKQFRRTTGLTIRHAHQMQLAECRSGVLEWMSCRHPYSLASLELEQRRYLDNPFQRRVKELSHAGRCGEREYL